MSAAHASVALTLTFLFCPFFEEVAATLEGTSASSPQWSDSNIRIPAQRTFFANVRIKGRLAKIRFRWSLGFDLRFANPRPSECACQIHSTGVHQIRPQSRAMYW